MEAHQKRVIKEKEDLDEKLKNLRAFMYSDTFAKLGVTDHARGSTCMCFMNSLWRTL